MVHYTTMKLRKFTSTICTYLERRETASSFVINLFLPFVVQSINIYIRENVRMRKGARLYLLYSISIEITLVGLFTRLRRRRVRQQGNDSKWPIREHLALILSTNGRDMAANGFRSSIIYYSFYMIFTCICHLRAIIILP